MQAVESGKIEEERRLMYAGVTRAQRSLFISYCERRKQRHETVITQASRFITELGDGVRVSGKNEPLPDRECRSAWLKKLREMVEE